MLLLDEPTSHLDLKNQRQVLGMLRTLRDQGVTVVFTTHDPNAAAAVSDLVVLLRKGEVVSFGPMERTLTREHLSDTYGVPVEVVPVEGRPTILVR